MFLGDFAGLIAFPSHLVALAPTEFDVIWFALILVVWLAMSQIFSAAATQDLPESFYFILKMLIFLLDCLLEKPC